MFKTNFKIAWRVLARNKQFAILNLIGLTIGLSCTFLIYLWVDDEMKMDKFNEKNDRLFQVMQNIPMSSGIQTFEGTPGLLATTLVNELPDIENAAAVRPGFNKGILSANDKKVKAKEQYVSVDFFNIFSYRLIEGDKNTVFAKKSAVVISDELALKLFNSTKNIVGKTIEWDFNEFSGSYIVSGVFHRPPFNSSSQFDILFSFDVFLEKRPQFRDWGNSNPHTYIVVKKGVDVDQLNKKITTFIKLKSNESKSTLFLRPYSDKYLYGKYENGVQSGGRIEYVRLFSIVAIFILLIACINFINLSTAQASRRLKETGIKKVMGARRNILILQFLGEALAFSLLSLVLSIGIVLFFLPYFNQITGKQILVTLNFRIILSMLATVLAAGLMAGSYPAFYLSSFKPVTVLKGRLMISLGEQWIRKGLVTFQFTMSVIFIIAVIVIHRQMELIQTKNLGYDSDNVVYFEKEGKSVSNVETFLEQIRSLPGIQSAGNMGYDFVGGYGFTSGVSWEGKRSDMKIEFGNMEIGYNLVETLGYSMLQGRSFSKAFGSDSAAIIFNHSAIMAMGLKNPIGKTVELWGEKRTIIGVINDFNFESLHEKIKPCFLRLSANADKIIVKIKAGQEKSALAGLQQFYRTYTQGQPLEYNFFDEAYSLQYTTEKRIYILSGYFSVLAIIISCLGMFGLAAFTARKRQKEISIRKISGASTINIAIILSKDFLKVTAVAMLLAFPIAWLIMNQWLSNFAYHIHIGVGIFAISGILIFLITFFTISTQTIKASKANPVKSLRTE